MEKFTVLNGLVAPLDRANVDTDQIIPKQYLSSIKRTGFAQGLFGAWRKDPQFVLNQPRYRESTILLARRNFGCGSSREHAPWALMDYGFRCVIAPSFADIFFNNSFKNGFLPVVLSESEVDGLFHDCAAFPGFRLVVDLAEQTVCTTDRSKVMRFEIDPFRKYCLQGGLDEVALTLKRDEAIAIYAQLVRKHPRASQTRAAAARDSRTTTRCHSAEASAQPVEEHPHDRGVLLAYSPWEGGDLSVQVLNG